jgi:deazaflavin-dependent oxidoreductase (nitroreductase family)
MGFEPVTLALVSTLHLSNTLGGGSKPFNPTAAGIAEALIGLALAAGAVALWRTPRGRAGALAATVFAVAGFLVGLGFTISGGDAVDIAYHAVMLPLLVFTLVALLRLRSVRRGYIRPPWTQRQIANRLVPRFRPDIISLLSVPGRRTGRPHTVPVAVLEDDGQRYLVSYRGASDWALNLRASRHGTLSSQGHREPITVSEVPVSERPRLLDLYRSRYGAMPTVGAVLRALPDPADHPIFRIGETDPASFAGQC